MSQRIKKWGQKTLRFLRLEKPVFVIVNKITSRYAWSYLKGVNLRGEILFNIINSNIKSGDNFLDIMCGYSPLAGPLLKSGYHITGFDDNREAISDLRKIYPDGKWLLSSYDNLKVQSDADRPFSVFLLLGAFELCSQQSFISSMDKLLNVNKPRVFFLETNRFIEKAPTIANPFVEESTAANTVYLTGYNAMLKLLIDHGYEVIDVGQYDAQFKEKWARFRMYAILRVRN